MEPKYYRCLKIDQAVSMKSWFLCIPAVLLSFHKFVDCSVWVNRDRVIFLFFFLKSTINFFQVRLL